MTAAGRRFGGGRDSVAAFRPMWRVVSAAGGYLVRSVAEGGEVDVAMLTAPSAGHFTITALAEEEIVLTAPSGHVLAERSAVRLEDLDGVPLIHFASDNGLSVWLNQSFARAGVHPETVMRTSVTAAAP